MDISCDVPSLELLQQEVPVLFALIENLPSFPLVLIAPILDQFILVAQAAFIITDEEVKSFPYEETENSLAVFPQLPCIRSRKQYTADRTRSTICTKRSTGHTSLLPGIFTLYCQHGIMKQLIST